MNDAPSLSDDASAAGVRAMLLEIAARMSEFLGVERSSIYLHDPENNVLWTPAAQGLTGAEEIRIKPTQGIAGAVFTSGEVLRIDDPYSDPRFLPEVDLRTGFKTRNLYCRPLQTSAGHRIGVIQLLNRTSGPLGERDEALLDILCQQAAIAIENVQLFHGVRRLRESELALHTELETKHAELRRAFLEIERTTSERSRLEQTMRKVRIGVLAFSAVVVVLVGIFVWRAGQPSSAGAQARTAAEPSTGDVVWQPVTTGPVESTIALLGNIEPVEIRHLSSAFRGRIAEKHFHYGELVEKGAILARIDATELEVELRKAETDNIRARAELRRLESWQDGPEVARATRALRKARLSYEANLRNLDELQQLSQLGIIAASTLDSARQRLETEETDLKAAEEDLAGVQSSASEDRITIARHDVQNTQLRVDELRSKLDRADIVAPFSGIVILPNARAMPGRAASNAGYYETGMTIAQGDVLLSIGNMEAIAVRMQADEADVARIQHGQKVHISGEALPGVRLLGRVSYLSSQAILTSGRPYFEVAVSSTTLTEDDRAAIRLGMTAMVRIVVYDEPSVALVPAQAVFTDQGRSYVWRRSGRDGPAERVAVEVGAVSASTVEIRKGLVAGDVVASDPVAASSGLGNRP